MGPTKKQLAFFETFGFIKFPGAFKKEAQDIISSFEEVWADNGGGHAGEHHDFKRRSAIAPFIDQDEYLSALIDHPLIEGMANVILEANCNYTGSDGNFYVGDTNWHSDNFRGQYRAIKMAFYLDPVTKDTGCLRVVPGSHIHTDQYAQALHEVTPFSVSNDNEEVWGVHGSDVPAYPIESEPGDLLVFDQAIKHSSWGGGDRRRMFTINWSERYKEKDQEALRESIAGMAAFWHDRAYGTVMIETASSARMVHLEQRLANDDHLPQLLAEAKKEMVEPSRGGGQFDRKM